MTPSVLTKRNILLFAPVEAFQIIQFLMLLVIQMKFINHRL